MAKRKRQSDVGIFERRLKEGRGVGRGKDYVPWFLVQDVPSQGLANRVKGTTTGRVHHVLSQLENKGTLGAANLASRMTLLFLPIQ